MRVRAAPEAITTTICAILKAQKGHILSVLTNSRESARDSSAGPAIHMSWLAPNHSALGDLNPDKWPWQVFSAAIYSAHKYECLDAGKLAAAVAECGAKGLLRNRGEIDRLAAEIVMEIFQQQAMDDAPRITQVTAQITNAIPDTDQPTWEQ